MPFDSTLRKVALALTRIPSATYHEHLIRAEVIRLLRGLPHLQLRLDRFGNLIAHYRHRPRTGHSLALVAHLDHPGFVIPDEAHRIARTAQFLGGVANDYFKKQRVLFYSGKSTKSLGNARIARLEINDNEKIVHFDRDPPPQAQFGMWDLPANRFTRTRFQGRACDDLVGVSTILSLLIHLTKTNARAEVYGLITRAEEVGFHGALANLKDKKTALPKIPVFSIETSNVRGFAQMDAGPILRVGDRLSIFTPQVTQWLHDSFEALKKSDKTVTYQRLLMSGGTCEATVFQQSAYPTGALCLALENYHNMGADGKIRSEAVSLNDWQQLYRFLHYLATDAPAYVPHSGKPQLSPRLRDLQNAAVKRLLF